MNALLSSSGQLITLCLWLLCGVMASAQTPIEEYSQLYLGIEDNRFPYTDLDQDRKPAGILLDYIDQLCEQIETDCEYVPIEFDRLLDDIKTFKLNGVIVIDSAQLTDNEQIKLISPLCQPTPVLIQRKNDSPFTKVEDVKKGTIGVLRGSSPHLHLLNYEKGDVTLKPYLVLESGVIDLVTGRIEALLADAAFFQARVGNTILGQTEENTRLIAAKADMAGFPTSNITIAIQNNHVAQMTKLEDAMQKTGKPGQCIQLLQNDKSKTAVKTTQQAEENLTSEPKQQTRPRNKSGQSKEEHR